MTLPRPDQPNRPESLDAPSASLGETLAHKRRHASANRRATGAGGSRAYSVMLIASTLVAAAFCLLYITKPVIITFQDQEMAAPEGTAARDRSAMREEQDEEVVEPAEAANPAHEETNLRVQHVLNATTVEGELSRILLDVPVIYTSRQLRWTDEEVAHARSIHARLADYHEQSRNLREFGSGLLAEWNALIERSIPAADLRADSPSLPANQEDASPFTRPANLDTTEAIEIHPVGP